MEWIKRAVVGASAAWIGFVILACTDGDTEVSGDRAIRGGGCPEGETCAPPASAPRFFVGAKPPAAESPTGELPPVATGAMTWVRFVEDAPPSDSWFPEEYVDVRGAVLEGELPLTAEVRRSGGAWLSSPTAGRFMVRALDEAGALHDQTRIRVVDPTEAYVRPVFLFDAVGPERGWRVWPNVRMQLIERARSADGELLVSFDAPDEQQILEAETPPSGPLVVEASAGELSATTSFPPATEVESVVSYRVDSELLGLHVCVFGSQYGDPIIGAPLEVTETEGRDREPEALGETFPCIAAGEEARSVRVSSGDAGWVIPIPAWD